MALSNTAIPKYYAAFRDAVLRGERPVCEYIALEMNRIDALIENPLYYYDESVVEGFIRYNEDELTLTDGSDLKMLDEFKLWAEQLYGWYYFEEAQVYEKYPDGPGGHFVKKLVKRRLTKKQFIILGRGGAKTMYLSGNQSYVQNIDCSTTDQIAVAPTIRQADETLSPIRTAIIRSKGPMFKFLTDGSINNTTGSKAKRVKLASTKKGIENFITGSIIEPRPMSIDKLQGLRCKYATLDEWLSGDIREDPIGALEQGSAKFPEYWIIAASSEGTVRNGPGDSIKMELKKILHGEYYAPHVSIWYYKLDDIKEVADPNMWIKAQPNIGKTVSYEAYQRDVDRMTSNPAIKNDILAKRFGIEVEGLSYFFPYSETLPFAKQNFDTMACSMGGDLSQGDDFCAFTFLFPLSNGCLGIKTRNYITHTKYLKVTPALRQKYDEFIAEGTLRVMDGKSEVVLDMDDVYEDLNEYIDLHQYDVICEGHDPYNAAKFYERWTSENGPFGSMTVPQGARTESVPLGEIKNMSEYHMLIFDESLFSWSMGHCITLEDTNGNRKLYKRRHEEKIDAVAAFLDAYVAYKNYIESFS